MTAQEKIVLYKNKAQEHCEGWYVTDPQVVSLCQSVMMTRDEFIMGGGFVQAVVNNDLLRAVTNADPTSLQYLKVITLAKNCYIHEEVYR
jgi:hypothetical protein